MRTLMSLAAVALAYLISPTAYAQTKTEDSIDGVQMCRARNAEQRQQMNAGEMPLVVKRLGLLFASDTICACVDRQLRASGGVVVKESEVARLMKANGFCMSAEVNATFPPQCVATYRELLPLMGYPVGTDTQLGSVCQCASRVMRERLTPDALYKIQMDAFDEYNARRDQKQRSSKTPTDPFQMWMSELHSCAATTLGAPRKN